VESNAQSIAISTSQLDNDSNSDCDIVGVPKNITISKTRGVEDKTMIDMLQ
jgi:hypothetical protein